MLTPDDLQAAFDVADKITNANGYADNATESDTRAELRDRIYAALIVAMGGTYDPS